MIMNRFACDSLNRHRLTAPMLKGPDGNLAPASWEDAILTVAKMLDSTPADNIAAVAGELCDAEVSFNIDCCSEVCHYRFCKP